MHGKKFLVKEAHFGSDGANFYLRVDFHPGRERELTAMEAKLTVQPLDGAPASHPRRPRPALPVFALARRPPHGRRPPARLAGNGRHRPGGNGGVKAVGRASRPAFFEARTAAD
jgi:hypothetical protein